MREPSSPPDQGDAPLPPLSHRRRRREGTASRLREDAHTCRSSRSPPSGGAGRSSRSAFAVRLPRAARRQEQPRLFNNNNNTTTNTGQARAPPPPSRASDSNSNAAWRHRAARGGGLPARDGRVPGGGG